MRVSAIEPGPTSSTVRRWPGVCHGWGPRVPRIGGRGPYQLDEELLQGHRQDARERAVDVEVDGP